MGQRADLCRRFSLLLSVGHERRDEFAIQFFRQAVSIAGEHPELVAIAHYEPAARVPKRQFTLKELPALNSP